MKQSIPDGAPIVRAFYDEKTKQLKFYCQYCKTWHEHAAEEGHRVAHCNYWEPHGKRKGFTTPYVETGYILQRVGLLTAKVRKLRQDA
jgi:hypothetical protein